MKTKNITLLLYTLPSALIFIIAGILIGLHERQVQNNQLAIIHVEPKTEVRCADWSKAELLSENLRSPQLVEELYGCPTYKVYLVRRWSVYHSAGTGYNIKLLKELADNVKEEN